MKNSKTGVNITDLGLNDFRMDLLQYVKSNNDLKSVPNGMHAIIPAQAGKGLTPGVIFTLRNRDSELNILQHNRLHPYYLVYLDMQGRVITDHTEIKRLLDLVRTSCKGLDQPILDLCRAFNKETQDGRKMERYSDLLSQTIRSIIDVKEEDIDSLFSGPRTTALINTISGMDDFELIAFLVIKEE